MSITTEKAVRSSAVLVTTRSDTSLAGSAGRSSATRAGRGSTALSVSIQNLCHIKMSYSHGVLRTDLPPYGNGLGNTLSSDSEK